MWRIWKFLFTEKLHAFTWLNMSLFIYFFKKKAESAWKRIWWEMVKVAETHRGKKCIWKHKWSWFYPENFPQLLFSICASELQNWWFQKPQSDKASRALVAWGGSEEPCQCPSTELWWDAALFSPRWCGDVAGVWTRQRVAAEKLVMD